MGEARKRLERIEKALTRNYDTGDPGERPYQPVATREDLRDLSKRVTQLEIRCPESSEPEEGEPGWEIVDKAVEAQHETLVLGNHGAMWHALEASGYPQQVKDLEAEIKKLRVKMWGEVLVSDE